MKVRVVKARIKSAGYVVEQQLRSQGYLLVAGIDEVGRGALAGPLVSAVVVLPPSCRVRFYDSKQIDASRRAQLSARIQEIALGYGLGWVSNLEIDEFGLPWALQTSYERALEQMGLEVSKIILDGSVNYLAEYECCDCVVKADSKVASVAAASIIAKHARDEYMKALCEKYPEYCFETNVGYGTKYHRQVLAEQGLTDLHRRSFCTNLL